jgi:tetratricopeptide (TPR) repeat protein
VDYCLAVPDPRPGAVTYNCACVWEDPERDLALLAVEEDESTGWVAAVGGGIGPALAEPGTGVLHAEAIGYPDATVEGDVPHPEQAPGLLLPGGGAVYGEMPFDVDSSVPDDARLWEGMSGAAVRDSDSQRLVGVVVRADPDRQRRRLYVRALPDPAVDARFMRALDEVGVRPVLEAANAPEVRRLLAVWDEAGRPLPVRLVTKLSRFGVRRARADVDLHGNSYYPYVRRPFDDQLDGALDRRVQDTDRRMLLLVGDAMSGKSRVGANALRAHSTLSTRPLLVPHPGANLHEVVELVSPTGAVLWLDDLNTYLTGLDGGVLRDWQTRPGLVVVATLRSDLEREFLKPELRPAWVAIDDSTLVERLNVPEEWSEQEQQALSEAEPIIRSKVAAGLSLGEVLGAADVLRDHLRTADPFRSAVVFAVIDWARIGFTDGIPESLAEDLWPEYLSRKNATVFGNREVDERHDDYQKVVRWARQPIPGTGTMLLTRRNDRLHVDDYLVAHRPPELPATPHAVWEAALHHAMADQYVMKLPFVGMRAADAGETEIARIAYQTSIERKDQLAPIAKVGLGGLLMKEGDTKSASALTMPLLGFAFKDMAPSLAQLGLAMIQQGDLERAQTFLRPAAYSRHPEHAPQAALFLGMVLAKEGDLDGARTAYQVAIDSGHAEHAPLAAVILGELLAKEGDLDGARTAYQVAIDSGHAEHAPKAAFALGRLLAKQGDLDGARTAYQAAIDSGHAERAPLAALALGVLLGERGDLDGARTAYQAAIDSGHAERAPQAAVILGELLAKEGDLDGARTAYQVAIDSGHAEHAPLAAAGLAVLLDERGDFDGARTALQVAIDSGHAELAPQAALILGEVLGERGDLDGARTAYQAAIDSGHAELAPQAALALGRLLAKQGDLDGARTAYQAAIDSGHDPESATAELLLGEQCTEGDLEARKQHRARAVASGLPDLLVSVAQLYLADGDLQMGRQFLEEASNAGFANANRYLLLFPEPGTDPPNDEAIVEVTAAAAAGDTDAMNVLGLHAAAHGDSLLAGEWWTRSAQLGDLTAMLLAGRTSPN